jgi:hypothetical protein
MDFFLKFRYIAEQASKEFENKTLLSGRITEEDQNKIDLVKSYNETNKNLNISDKFNFSVPEIS